MRYLACIAVAALCAALMGGGTIDPSYASPTATPKSIASKARRYRLKLRPGAVVARIEIPKLRLFLNVRNGTDPAILRRGPARHLGTFLPGEGELVYVAGHRSMYTAPFRRLDTLRFGDRVRLVLPYATFEYAITRHVVVPDTAIERLRSPGYEVLALQTSPAELGHIQRYIAYARVFRIRPPGY